MSIQIISCGSQSPVGTWTSMSAANVRAGLARISVHPDYEDAEWSPIKVAMADYLDRGLPNLPRFLKLGVSALKETLAPIKELNSLNSPIPLFIGLPGERDGLHPDLTTKIIKRLESVEQEFNISFQTEFVSDDHTSGLIAINAAIQLLEKGEAEFCIAGGIESYINPATLKWLEEKEHLKCNNNKWGMIPGEAAGFCLLTTTESADRHQLPCLAEIVAISEKEEIPVDDQACLGKALSQAIKTVVKEIPDGEKIHQVYCDMNGQRHRADEYMYSILRLNQYFESTKDFIAPANLWGDLGAASAPLLIGLATESGRKSYAKGPNNLIFTMSPGSKRAAALIKLNLTAN